MEGAEGALPWGLGAAGSVPVRSSSPGQPGLDEQECASYCPNPSLQFSPGFQFRVLPASVSSEKIQLELSSGCQRDEGNVVGLL